MGHEACKADEKICNEEHAKRLS